MNRRKSIRRIFAAAAAALCLSAAALPSAAYADALIEEFWFTMYDVDYYVVVDAPDGGVNLRYGAGTEYPTVLDGMIPNGTVLHIDAEARANNGKYWGATEYDGWSGFVFLGQTKKTAPPAETTAAETAAETTAETAAETTAAEAEAVTTAVQGPTVPEETTAAPETAASETAAPETAVGETSAAAETSTAAETSAAGKDWLNGLLGLLRSLIKSF